MKNQIKWLGIIALLAVIGLSFAACDNGTTDAENAEKSIKITGIPAEYHNTFFYISVYDADKTYASGGEQASGSTLTCEMYSNKYSSDGTGTWDGNPGWVQTEERWTGKGTFNVGFFFFIGDDFIFNWRSAQAINIKNAVTTISFSKFQ